MKHNHDAEISINIPKQDLEELIDKVTDSAIKIILTVTAAQIVKAVLTSKTP